MDVYKIFTYRYIVTSDKSKRPSCMGAGAEEEERMEERKEGETRPLNPLRGTLTRRESSRSVKKQKKKERGEKRGTIF